MIFWYDFEAKNEAFDFNIPHYEPNVRMLSTSSFSSNRSQSHLTEEVSVFGAFADEDPLWGPVMTIVIVLVVLAVEKLFEAFHHLTKETAYNKMISLIQKELMNVGVTAFLIKIVLNTTTFLNHSAILALEYADLIVPIFSFCCCSLGICLIFSALFQSADWSRAYCWTLDELFNDFYRHAQTCQFRFLISPLNNTILRMEFRIFHNIFCETYSIKRNAFAFDEYVNKVFEEFVLHIIQIRIHNWVFFLALSILLMILSKEDGFKISRCADTSLDSECQRKSQIGVFTIFGAIIYLVTALFALLMRRYELKMLLTRGIASWEMYPDFLSSMEGALGNKAAEKNRFDEAELKEVINRNKIEKKKLPVTTASAKIITAYQNLSSVPSMKNIGGFISIRRLYSTRTLHLPRSNAARLLSVANSIKQLPFISSQSNNPDRRRMSLKPFINNEKKEVDLKNESFNRGLVTQTSSLDFSADTVYGRNSFQAAGSNSIRLAHLSSDTFSLHNSENQERYTCKTNFESKSNVYNETQTFDDVPTTILSADQHVIQNEHQAIINHDSSQPMGQANFPHEEPSIYSISWGSKDSRWNDDDDDLETGNLSKGDFRIHPLSADPIQKQNDTNAAEAETGIPVTTGLALNLAKIPKGQSHSFLLTPSTMDGSSQKITGAEMEIIKKNSGSMDGKNGSVGGLTPKKLWSFHELNLSKRSLRMMSSKDMIKSGSTELGVSAKKSLPKHHEDLKNIFLFSSPWIHFEFIQFLVMVIALYLALWITNFSFVSPDVGWAMLSLTPGILCAINYLYIVKVAAMLKAMYQLDNDVALEVIEQREGSRQLADFIRMKVLSKLKDLGGDPKEQMKALFLAIDENGSNELSRKEFSQFMSALEIQFSRKKWTLIYHEVDRNFDDKITFDEFCLFIFPEKIDVKLGEMWRLKKLNKSVMKYTKIFQQERNTRRKSRLSSRSSDGNVIPLSARFSIAKRPSISLFSRKNSNQIAADSSVVAD